MLIARSHGSIALTFPPLPRVFTLGRCGGGRNQGTTLCEPRRTPVRTVGAERQALTSPERLELRCDLFSRLDAELVEDPG
jgi:hypothetical protein